MTDNFRFAEHSEAAGCVHEERAGLHGHGVHAVRRPQDLLAGSPPSCQREKQARLGNCTRRREIVDVLAFPVKIREFREPSINIIGIFR